GLRTDLVTYPSDRIAQVMAGQRDDLVVRVYGADLTVLQEKAREIRAMLTGVPGVRSPSCARYPSGQPGTGRAISPPASGTGRGPATSAGTRRRSPRA